MYDDTIYYYVTKFSKHAITIGMVKFIVVHIFIL